MIEKENSAKIAAELLPEVIKVIADAACDDSNKLSERVAAAALLYKIAEAGAGDGAADREAEQQPSVSLSEGIKYT